MITKIGIYTLAVACNTASEVQNGDGGIFWDVIDFQSLFLVDAFS